MFCISESMQLIMQNGASTLISKRTCSESKPRPWRPCFLWDQNSFKESKRGPPKENSYHFVEEDFFIIFISFDAMATRILYGTDF